MNRWQSTGTATLSGRTVRIAITPRGELFAQGKRGWRAVSDWELTNITWED